MSLYLTSYFFVQELSILQDIGDLGGESRAHGNLGAVHMSLGNNTLALRCFQEQLERSKVSRQINRDREGERVKGDWREGERVKGDGEGERGKGDGEGERELKEMERERELKEMERERES